MKDYAFLILAALLLAAVFALSKLYQQKEGTSPAAGFRFNILVGLSTSAIFWAIGGFRFHVTPFSLLLAFGVASLCMLYSLIGFRILKSGSMALYSLFLMVGGMTIPYLWGLFFLNEQFSLLRTVGLLLLIGAVALSNVGQKGVSLKLPLLLMCCTIFFLNGMTSVFSKLHQIETVYETVSSTDFVVLAGLSKCVLGLGGLIVCHLRQKRNPEGTQKKRPNWKAILPIILLVAIADGSSYFLQLAGAATLPATVLYPFVTGGSMVFSTIVGMVAFREKPSKILLVSIAVCFVGTLMFL